MVDQPHERARVGFADEVDASVQWRVPVACLAALHELDLAAEVIDDRLMEIANPGRKRTCFFSKNLCRVCRIA
jgi:hypothetical protein